MGKAGVDGIKGSRDPTFLLLLLFPLQAGHKSTAHSMAQPLAQWEEVGAGLATLCGADQMPGALGSSSWMLGDPR